MLSRSLVVVLALSVSTCYGAILTSLPAGGTTTTFPGGSTVDGAGTVVVAGFSMTSTTSWVHDYSSSFGLSSNGEWNGLGMVGINDSSGSITIDLGGLYSSVGGFMNYSESNATISAIAEDGTTVLETYVLGIAGPISTPAGVTDGAFRGIERGSADIRYFQISNGYAVMSDITVSTAVPEAGTSVMLCAGLALLASLRGPTNSRTVVR